MKSSGRKAMETKNGEKKTMKNGARMKKNTKVPHRNLETCTYNRGGGGKREKIRTAMPEGVQRRGSERGPRGETQKGKNQKAREVPNSKGAKGESGGGKRGKSLRRFFQWGKRPGKHRGTQQQKKNIELQNHTTQRGLR